MARQVVFVDDIDGSDEAQTVEFAVGGVAYEIDLGPANRERFDKALTDFIEHARKVGAATTPAAQRAKRPAGSRTLSQNREHAQAVRDWALREGMEVSERGRIPGRVLEAFDEAHGEAKPVRTIPDPADRGQQRKLRDEANALLKTEPKAEVNATVSKPKPSTAPPALFSAPQPSSPAPERAEDGGSETGGNTTPEPSDDNAQVHEVTKAAIIEWMQSKGMKTEGVRYLTLLKVYREGHPGVEVRYVKDAS